MIIQCPECSKRYRVAEGLIAAGGRLVRCAACEYEWLVRPEDDQSLHNLSDQAELEANEMPEGYGISPIHIEMLREELRLMEPAEPHVNANNELKSQAKSNAFAGGMSEVVVNLPPAPKTEQKNTTCRIWGQLTTAALSIFISAFIVLLIMASIWPQEVTKLIPQLESPLESIGIYNSDGIRIASVALRSNYGERDLDMQVDVVIENTATAERFISKLRFVSYDAEMKKLGDIALDVSATIPKHETKRVQGVLHRLPLATRYISLDIGDGVTLTLRDMDSLYKFTK